MTSPPFPSPTNAIHPPSEVLLGCSDYFRSTSRAMAERHPLDEDGRAGEGR